MICKTYFKNNLFIQDIPATNAPGNIFSSTGSMLSKEYFCFNITPCYVINDM